MKRADHSLEERRSVNRTLIWICVESMVVLVILLLAVLFAPPGATVSAEDSVKIAVESSGSRGLHHPCAPECERACAPPETCFTINKDQYE
jgi:hypothetical protein